MTDLGEWTWLPEMEEGLRNGTKLATIRRERPAQKGDILRGFGMAFEVDDMVRAPLRDIARFYYPVLGVRSAEEVLAQLERCYLHHPPLDQIVNLIRFHRRPE